MGIVVTQPAAEARVRRHFDTSPQLYIGKQLAVYHQSVQQRLEMLRNYAGVGRNDAFTVLDVGCGAGLFLDLLLDSFPKARATGFDLSREMLLHNSISDRKRVFVGDALKMPRDLGEFDVICIDTLMHHLISSTSYGETVARIAVFLAELQGRLSPGGVVLIREIYHEYFGIEDLGCRAIYLLSTLRVPQIVERGLKRIGLQTANAGVCFLTRSQWEDMFQQSGLHIIEAEDHRWPGQPYRKLGFAASGDIHYLLRPTRPII